MPSLLDTLPGVYRTLLPAAFGRPAPEETPVWALLDALRAEVGRVVHAANNPLTVIAGNAQFLLELARTTEIDPAFARPLEDIEAAAHQLQQALAELSAVRQRVADIILQGVGEQLRRAHSRGK